MRSLFALGLVLSLAGCTLDLGGDDDRGGGDRFCGGFTGQQCAADEYCDFPTDECEILDGSGTCRERPLTCPEIYAPVVGGNGEIYGNACEAHAAGTDDCGPAAER